MKKIYLATAVIAIICITLSIVIQIEKNQDALDNGSRICNALDPQSNCQKVQSSVYGETFGVSNPVYGMIGFGMLLIISIILLFSTHSKEDTFEMTLRWMVETAGVISASFAAWFLYVQISILHAYCIFCVIVDILSIVLFGITIYLLVKYK